MHFICYIGGNDKMLSICHKMLTSSISFIHFFRVTISSTW